MHQANNENKWLSISKITKKPHKIIIQNLCIVYRISDSLWIILLSQIFSVNHLIHFTKLDWRIRLHWLTVNWIGLSLNNDLNCSLFFTQNYYIASIDLYGPLLWYFYDVVLKHPFWSLKKAPFPVHCNCVEKIDEYKQNLSFFVFHGRKKIIYRFGITSLWLNYRIFIFLGELSLYLCLSPLMTH